MGSKESIVFLLFSINFVFLFIGFSAFVFGKPRNLECVYSDVDENFYLVRSGRYTSFEFRYFFNETKTGTVNEELVETCSKKSELDCVQDIERIQKKIGETFQCYYYPDHQDGPYWTVIKFVLSYKIRIISLWVFLFNLCVLVLWNVVTWLQTKELIQ